MKNFNTNIQCNNYPKYPKQNFYFAQNDDINIINIHSSKDDFDYITFRGSIYHDLNNKSNFQNGFNGENKNRLPTENYNYNNNGKPLQLFINQNSNYFDNNNMNKEYYSDININIINNTDNNQNIRTKQRAFSQESDRYKFSMTNKYNFRTTNNNTVFLIIF